MKQYDYSIDTEWRKLRRIKLIVGYCPKLDKISRKNLGNPRKSVV